MIQIKSIIINHEIIYIYFKNNFLFFKEKNMEKMEYINN